MESIYNKYVQDRFKSHEPPVKGLRADIVEYQDQYLGLRLYRSNFEQYNAIDKNKIILWCNEVLEDLIQVVPISLEVWK